MASVHINGPTGYGVHIFDDQHIIACKHPHYGTNCPDYSDITCPDCLRTMLCQLEERLHVSYKDVVESSSSLE